MQFGAWHFQVPIPKKGNMIISETADSEIAPAGALNASGVLFDLLSETVYNTR